MTLMLHGGPPLVACVPNISEGRDLGVLTALSEAISSVEGVWLLHVDTNETANRSVFTFIGSQESVSAAAQRLVDEAMSRIDMRGYHGSHPFIGALDVCPFVPLYQTSMEQCVELAHKLGAYTAERWGVPVFFYGYASKRSRFLPLHKVRKRGYQSFLRAGGSGDWNPDLACSVNVLRSGAAIFGARDVLIAFNVNLDSKDLGIAKSIAASVRRYFIDTGALCSASGEREMRPVQALGWYMPQYSCTQVSMNLLDYRRCGLADAYRVVDRSATALGAKLMGSELVGMVPKAALLSSAERGESESIAQCVRQLGLDSVKPFYPERQVLEYAIEARDILA